MTSTLARQAMSAEPDRVAPTDTLQQDAATMRNLQVAYLPVCDDHGDPHGFIAQRDIDLRCLTDDGDPGAATAATHTQNPWATIGVDDPVDHAWPQVTDRQGPPLPVLVGRHLVGVIRPGDLTAAPAHPRPGRPETAGSAATIGGDALPTAGPNPAGVPLDPSTPRPLDPDSAGRPRSAPPEERPASVVVAGVDGSPGSASAARWAAEQARRRQQTLHLVHAYHVAGHPGSSHPPGRAAVTRAEGELVLNRAAAQVGRHHRTATGRSAAGAGHGLRVGQPDRGRRAPVRTSVDPGIGGDARRQAGQVAGRRDSVATRP